MIQRATNELEFASLSSSTDKNSNIQDDDPDDPAALSSTESSPTQSHLGLLQPRPPVQEPGQPLEQDPTLALSAPDSLPLHVPPGLTARLPRPPGREEERETSQAAAHQETLKDTLKFFPELLKVLKIFATLPVTSCEAERSFSTLKRLKTFIRSTMGEERLNSLAVLNIHREICNLVMEKDTDKLVNKFSEGQGRSMYFF